MKRKLRINVEHPLAGRRSERGVALLISLGFLSLLLVAALAFAANAIAARKSASYGRTRSQADMLARSAVNNIMASIKKSASAQNLVSDDKDSKDTDTYTDSLEKLLLETSVAGADYNEDDLPEACADPRWRYVRDTTAAGDDKPIIGRVAYFPLPASNLNLSVVARGSGGLVNQPERNWKKRFGADIRELFPGSDGDYTGYFQELAEKFSEERYGSTDAGNFDAPTTEIVDYQSWDEVFDRLDINKDKKKWLQNNFVTSRYTEPEVFAYDPDFDNHNRDKGANAYELSPQTKYYHRFDLTNPRLKCDQQDAAGNIIPKLTVADLFGNPDEFSPRTDSGEKSGTALPFLKMISHADDNPPARRDNNFGDKKWERLRGQIAANFLDYCDVDHIPTWGVYENNAFDTSERNAEGWMSKLPHFTGNERTPYINEVVLEIINTTTINENDVPVMQIKCRPHVELINIYGSNVFGQGRPVKIKVRIAQRSIKAGTADNAHEEQAPALPKNNYEITGILDMPDRNSYQVFDGQEKVIHEVATPANTNLEIVHFRVHVMLEVTDNDGKLQRADFAKNLTFGNGLTSGNTALPAGNSPVAVISYMADDPRQNLNQDDWSTRGGSGASFSTVKPNTTTLYDANINWGGKNTNMQDGRVGDREFLEDLTTAFIANRPMVSPMELGAIHRGKAWQTLNIGKANNEDYTHPKNNLATNINVGTSGTSYADGDGGILNQVKMTPKIYSPGKVNLNMNEQVYDEDGRIFRWLLSNITRNSSYDVKNHAEAEDDGSDNILTGKDLQNVADSIRSRVGDRRFLSRAQLLDESYVSGFIPANATKIERDALAGKTIALTGTGESGIFRFVIVAQSIKDIGVGTISKSDGKGNIKTKKTAIGTFDRDDDVYFDEITGEVKMLATIRYDHASGKVTLLSLEYLED